MMFKKIMLGFLGLVALTGVVGLVLHRPIIKPWYMRWGATDEEVQMGLPGDGFVTGEVSQSTRAIGIHAPAAQVWPWLVQMGQGRGGLYSYDFLENLVGSDIHSLDQIAPELQDLKVGDIFRIGPQKGLPYYQVLILEANRALVMRSVNPNTGEPGETWGFFLAEEQPGLTRLIIRHRSVPSLEATERTINAIVEPISFVMEHRMLSGIRDRAEKLWNGGKG